ncbi:MAG: hypothetical protein GY795_14890 [Desulfobacterales bacterium]|nr:hypothetical protein [Desulfobacterales bacterium]
MKLVEEAMDKDSKKTSDKLAKEAVDHVSTKTIPAIHDTVGKFYKFRQTLQMPQSGKVIKPGVS